MKESWQQQEERTRQDEGQEGASQSADEPRDVTKERHKEGHCGREEHPRNPHQVGLNGKKEERRILIGGF